jgi:thiamine pyrophosphate-dependent acetolactate synthase large subunit-like protein
MVALKFDKALPSTAKLGWGSDVAAEMLRQLHIEFVCVNPGSSFRGLHDSLVNYLGNKKPTLLLALHEQSVVAIAHGYAKAAGRPMAVVLHSNVGLMCATMSIFNAWCDRVPILMLGATGAVDSAVRRSWIDWNHTFRDQGSMIRNYVKWDDQPASPKATVDAMLRAYQMACTAPMGPAYVSLDRRLQEDALDDKIAFSGIERYSPPELGQPSVESISRAAEWLKSAKNPLLMIGRVSPNTTDWDARVQLAERLGAKVITTLRTGATFPTTHPLHGGPADLFISGNDRELLRKADVVLSLDWPDLADCLAAAKRAARGQKIIQVSIDYNVHNGYSGDHQRLVAADLNIAAEPDAIVQPLIKELGKAKKAFKQQPKSGWRNYRPSARLSTLTDIGLTLSALRKGRKLCLARVPLNWSASSYDFNEPLDYLGYDGGGGVGSGPGMAVGAALALAGSGRTVVGIMGDGEFLGASSALWTAAHYQIPVLIVVANNNSYFTDEIQQEAVARERGRPVENRWIGQRLDQPAIGITGLARSFGVEADGPVERASDLRSALEGGLSVVEAGRPFLVEVKIDPMREASLDWLAEH